MKRCPKCHRAYDDETLNFCLQDGALLAAESGSASSSHDPGATLRIDAPRPDDIKTEVFDGRASAATEQMPQTMPTLAQPVGRVTAQDSSGGAGTAPTQVPKTQNTPLVIGLTVVATLILIALVSGATWFFLRGDKASSPAGNTRLDENGNAPVNSSPATVNNPSLPNDNSPPPVARETPAPVDPAAIREQVSDVLNGWVYASRARDLNRHMSYYAATLDTYYKASNVSSSRVRADRARAYNLYHTLDIELSDVKITPDPSGQTASATFDKTWTFEGDTKYSSGSVHQKIWLTKMGGRWLITGEKDLQVYYVNNQR